MARPKSEDKREAILSAAMEVFATQGLSAPTSAISKSAGVAEGTLFTYFRTKDDLVNALYREIKLQLASALMSDFARHPDVRAKLRHVWDTFLDWGMANPQQGKVLAQLMVSGKLTAETRAVGAAPFAEIEAMGRDAIERGVVREIPIEFLSALMESIAATTMEFMARNPSFASRFRTIGFEAYWNAVVAR